MTPPKPSAVVLRAQSDPRLVALARGGSEAAFEALVRRHRQELVVHCRRLLLSEARAEDAVQQALLAAWQALLAGEEVQHPRAWLHRIAHNRALDARKRSGYDHVELQASLQGGELPQEEIERRTVVRETLAGLARLPEPQRDVLLRTAVHGDSYDQVASDLALPESTIRGMVSRARGTLRAAATAITPGPLVAWAAAAQPAAPVAHGLAEGLTVGGSAGLAGLTAKLAAATVVAGGAVAGLTSHHVVQRHAAAAPSAGRVAAAHTAKAHDVAPAAPVVVRASPVALTTPVARPHAATPARGGASSGRAGSPSGRQHRHHGPSGPDRDEAEHARPSGHGGSSDPSSSAHEEDGTPSSGDDGAPSTSASSGAHEKASGQRESSGDGDGTDGVGDGSGRGHSAGSGHGAGDSADQVAPVVGVVAVPVPVPAAIPEGSGGGATSGDATSAEHGGRSSSGDGGEQPSPDAG